MALSADLIGVALVFIGAMVVVYAIDQSRS